MRRALSSPAMRSITGLEQSGDRTMSERIDDDRRRLLRTAAVTVAAAGLGVTGTAKAQSGGERSLDAPGRKPGTNTSIGLLKQIDAGVLNVGYAEAGPADGPVV